MDEIPPGEVLFDHLPDGTILGPMPMHDGAAMAALLIERMPPATLKAVIEELNARAPEPRNA